MSASGGKADKGKGRHRLGDISSSGARSTQGSTFWPVFRSCEIPPREAELQPISVGSLLQSISVSDKYALRLKLTFKALEKLKILLGSYEH